MKQPSESIFFQSQLFVAELGDPVNYLEFLEEDKALRKQGSSKLDKLEKSTQSNKMAPKRNPYGAGWANNVLKDQFGVELAKVTQRYGNKWVIKKSQLQDSNDTKAFQFQVPRDIKSQEKFFRQTASKSNRRRLNKFINDIRISQNGSIVQNTLPKLRSEEKKPMPFFDINFHTKFTQFNI